MKTDHRTWLQSLLKAEAESLSAERRCRYKAARQQSETARVCSRSSVSSSRGTDGGETSTWRTEWLQCAPRTEAKVRSDLDGKRQAGGPRRDQDSPQPGRRGSQNLVHFSTWVREADRKRAGESSRPSLQKEGQSSSACGRSPDKEPPVQRKPHLVGDEEASMAAAGRTDSNTVALRSGQTRPAAVPVPRTPLALACKSVPCPAPPPPAVTSRWSGLGYSPSYRPPKVFSLLYTRATSTQQALLTVCLGGDAPPASASPSFRLDRPPWHLRSPPFLSGGELSSSAASMSGLVLRAKNALSEDWLAVVRTLGDASLLHQEAMATSSPHIHMQRPMLRFAPSTVQSYLSDWHSWALPCIVRPSA